MRSTWEWLVRATAGKRKAVIAASVAGVIVITGGGALATHAVTNQFANATISKLGGDDPEAVLDRIADRVVKQLLSSNGALGDVTESLGRAAGRKLNGIDTDALINRVTNKVATAGLGKLDGISTDAIVGKVTSALIERAMAELEKIDLQALARATLDGSVQQLLDSVDLEKLIREELDKIDVEAIISKVVKDQMSPSGLLSSLLGR